LSARRRSGFLLLLVLLTAALAWGLRRTLGR